MCLQEVELMRSRGSELRAVFAPRLTSVDPGSAMWRQSLLNRTFLAPPAFVSLSSHAGEMKKEGGVRSERERTCASPGIKKMNGFLFPIWR